MLMIATKMSRVSGSVSLKNPATAARLHSMPENDTRSKGRRPLESIKKNAGKVKRKLARPKPAWWSAAFSHIVSVYPLTQIVTLNSRGEISHPTRFYKIRWIKCQDVHLLVAQKVLAKKNPIGSMYDSSLHIVAVITSRLKPPCTPFEIADPWINTTCDWRNFFCLSISDKCSDFPALTTAFRWDSSISLLLLPEAENGCCKGPERPVFRSLEAREGFCKPQHIYVFVSESVETRDIWRPGTARR